MMAIIFGITRKNTQDRTWRKKVHVQLYQRRNQLSVPKILLTIRKSPA